MEINKPFLLFLGDVADQLAAKTAQGIVDWRRDWCLSQHRLSGCLADTGLPDMPITDAAEQGAKTMVIGAVNAGGVLADHWVESIVEALDCGLDIASGLHVKLSENPRIREAAQKNGRKLFDVRHSNQTFAVGKGIKRSGKRLLTVGTDCSVGKKYAALALEKAMRDNGFNATFCATGQTGILISQRGVSLDAVVSDFISGAAEWLSPDAEPDHWHVIEGQGSLFHPSFAGVSLGLLHGSQPDAFVVCHEPTRTTMRGVATPLPSIQQMIDRTIDCGTLTNPAIKCIGISINTAELAEKEAVDLIDRTENQYQLPTVDPVRFGCEKIVQTIRS